jgi:hypothetical protein
MERFDKVGHDKPLIIGRICIPPLGTIPFKALISKTI